MCLYRRDDLMYSLLFVRLVEVFNYFKIVIYLLETSCTRSYLILIDYIFSKSTSSCLNAMNIKRPSSSEISDTCNKGE